MSVTAVPLRPIKKGALAKFWIGLVVLLLVAAALVWAGTSDVRAQYASDDQFLAGNANEEGVVQTDSGLQYKILQEGEGPTATDDDIAVVKYTGTLRDGTVFDQNNQAVFPVTGVVPGFSEGLKKMRKGGSYRLWIPAELGYGAEDQANPQTGEVAIPGGSVLIFDVDMLDFRSRAEVEAIQRQMMEMQQQGGGAPGQLPGAPPPGQ